MNEGKTVSIFLIGADPVSLHKRVYALLVDTLLIMAVIFLGPVFGLQGKTFALMIFCFLFVYDPLLIFLFGQTAGHKLMKIVVVGNDGRKPSLIQAYIRFIMKCGLGMLSFFTMMHKGLAIHDYLSKTKVVDVPVK